MRVRILAASVFLISMVSCSVDEPFYIYNATEGAVVVEVGGASHSVERNATRKIRGLHYEGATITFGDGSKVSYEKSLKGLLENWSSLRKRYICDGFWSAEFHLVITRRRVLELRSCSEGGGPMELRPDSA